jgi:hypothetical protein
MPRGKSASMRKRKTIKSKTIKSKTSSKRKTVEKRPSGCVRQFTKKYMERSSPAFPANQCRGSVKMGNDGQAYESTRNSNGIYTWKKM